jgi:hypothetical protein
MDQSSSQQQHRAGPACKPYPAGVTSTTTHNGHAQVHSAQAMGKLLHTVARGYPRAWRRAVAPNTSAVGASLHVHAALVGRRAHITPLHIRIQTLQHTLQRYMYKQQLARSAASDSSMHALLRAAAAGSLCSSPAQPRRALCAPCSWALCGSACCPPPSRSCSRFQVPPPASGPGPHRCTRSGAWWRHSTTARRRGAETHTQQMCQINRQSAANGADGTPEKVGACVVPTAATWQHVQRSR